MADRIHLLSDALANQIAAGEVIQRPASVVKELLENAIDAGSSNIRVVIKDAGKTLIQVIDDGMGMSEVDARMSLEKHATSKISTTDDLFNIQTMGFRGEALPSMAAVAQLEIETCTEEAELGTRLVVASSTIKTQEPVSTSKGTKISVKNLFFNVPARRNFLKSATVETKHIIDEFQRVALARPDIAFSLYQNENETYQLLATKLSHRIVHLFGEAYKKQLVPCQEATDLIKFQGYIGKPTYAKKTRGEQFFFVNKRFIKSPYLHHAVKRAFEGLLPSDAFPFYVLFMDIAPVRIDVNVHPTKTEIKFEDERIVYSILEAAIRQALATHHIAPSLDFEQNVNFDPLGLQKSTKVDSPSRATERNYAQFKNLSTAKIDRQDWEKLLERLGKGIPTPKADMKQAPMLTLPSANYSATKEALTKPITASEINTSTMQLHARYILASVKSGLLLIDQSAAHERILYEKYLQYLTGKAGIAQQLLFPHHITLNPSDLALIKDCEEALQALGFVIESFGKDSIIVSGCPTEAANHEPKQLIEGLIEQYKWNKAQLTLSTQENLARSLAKRSCIQPGKKLGALEIDALIGQLFACKHANHTPDGYKTWVIVTLEELADLLKA
ncbi:MAG: DNA mismatch repair endonuclease MutL [Bacteroidota bacterium]